MEVKNIKKIISRKYNHLEVTNILNIIKTNNNNKMIYFSANEINNVYKPTQIFTTII